MGAAYTPDSAQPRRRGSGAQSLFHTSTCAPAWMMPAEAVISCLWTLMEHSGKFRLAMLRHLVHNFVH